MYVIRNLLLVVSFLPLAASAQSLKTEADVRAAADKVMATLASGGVKAAFATMKPYIIVPAAEFDAVVLQSQAQRDQVGTRFGKAVGTEFISQKKVGESLIKLTYIEKTEKHALPWEFYFYKTPNGWVLNSFRWNDNLPGLF